MTKDIEPKLRTIGDFLKIKKDEFFVIPEYQRGYSWNIIQCDKLWQDIEAFIESDKKDPYFFGTIIADCSISNEIRLIDGQQRTTTFILLLKAIQLQLENVISKLVRDKDTEALEEALKDKRNIILDILYKTDVEGRFEITKNWEIVKNVTMLKNYSINELNKKELQTIVESKSYASAEKTCYKYPRKQKDNKYTNFFRNFKFFYEKIGHYNESQLNKFAKTFLKECQVIEIRSWQTEQAITMFNSLNSTGMPLADADIISAHLYSNAGEDKRKFNETWENITRIVNELSTRKIINIDSVLQQYMYIKRASDKEYVRDGKQPDVTTPGLRRYYTIDKKELLKEPFELCAQFYKITQIWDTIKDYPTIKLLLKFNENAKIFLISYLSRTNNIQNITEHDVKDIAECLLKLFSILELVDAGYSSSNFKTFLFGENIKLVDKRFTIEEVKQDFQKHISTKWQRELLQQSLSEYDNNILVFLNEYLYAKEKELDFNFSESVNVEHIMPASGHNIEAIREDANIDSKEEFNIIVNKIGNKILLEEDINKSIGKDWFKTKKQKSINDKSGYKDSRYNIAHELTNYQSDTWGKDDIERATNKATNRILNFIFSTE